jgi:hypothetical protein
MSSCCVGADVIDAYCIHSDMHGGERKCIFSSHLSSNEKCLSILDCLLEGEITMHNDLREGFLHLHKDSVLQIFYCN